MLSSNVLSVAVRRYGQQWVTHVGGEVTNDGRNHMSSSGYIAMQEVCILVEVPVDDSSLGVDQRHFGPHGCTAVVQICKCYK